MTLDPTTTQYSKSDIFSWYNKARAAARQGKGKLDEARTNRALGYLQSGEAKVHWTKYGTALRSCGCPDYRKRKAPCKGMIALMIATRINQEIEEVAEVTTAPQTVTFTIWMQTNDPIGAINAGEDTLFKVLYSELHSTSNPDLLPMGRPACTAITDLIWDGFSVSNVALLKNKTGRSGWRGFYRITLVKE